MQKKFAGLGAFGFRRNFLISKIIRHSLIAQFLPSFLLSSWFQRIQQRSAATVVPKEEIEEPELNSTIPYLGRTNCINKAHSLIRDVFSNKKLFIEMRGKEDFQAVSTLLKTFSIELDSLRLAQKALPDSLFDLEYYMKHHINI